jgi:hypothetical protein
LLDMKKNVAHFKGMGVEERQSHAHWRESTFSRVLSCSPLESVVWVRDAAVVLAGFRTASARLWKTRLLASPAAALITSRSSRRRCGCRWRTGGAAIVSPWGFQPGDRGGAGAGTRDGQATCEPYPLQIRGQEPYPGHTARPRPRSAS